MKQNLFAKILDSVITESESFTNYIYLYHQNFHKEKTRVKIYLKTFRGHSDNGQYYQLNVVEGKLINLHTKKKYSPQFFKNIPFVEEARYANEAMNFINKGNCLADGLIIPYILKKKVSATKSDVLFINKNGDAYFKFCTRTFYAFLTHLGIKKKRVGIRHLLQKKELL